jgi:hypothetical protein
MDISMVRCFVVGVIAMNMKLLETSFRLPLRCASSVLNTPYNILDNIVGSGSEFNVAA